MSERDDGGSAFPNPPVVVGDKVFDEGEAPGMSLRDYFAAHAPKEPHPWFVPKAADPVDWSERGPKLPHGNSASVGHCEKCDEYFKATAAYNVDRDRRLSAYQLARSVEWPWAYADAMLAARKGEQS